jgi:hypothetical protein
LVKWVQQVAQPALTALQVAVVVELLLSKEHLVRMMQMFS